MPPYQCKVVSCLLKAKWFQSLCFIKHSLENTDTSEDMTNGFVDSDNFLKVNSDFETVPENDLSDSDSTWVDVL